MSNNVPLRPKIYSPCKVLLVLTMNDVLSRSAETSSKQDLVDRLRIYARHYYHLELVIKKEMDDSKMASIVNVGRGRKETATKAEAAVCKEKQRRSEEVN